jgi:hypothetical protein
LIDDVLAFIRHFDHKKSGEIFHIGMWPVMLVDRSGGDYFDIWERRADSGDFDP